MLNLLLRGVVLMQWTKECAGPAWPSLSAGLDLYSNLVHCMSTTPCSDKFSIGLQ